MPSKPSSSRSGLKDMTQTLQSLHSFRETELEFLRNAGKVKVYRRGMVEQDLVRRLSHSLVRFVAAEMQDAGRFYCLQLHKLLAELLFVLFKRITAQIKFHLTTHMSAVISFSPHISLLPRYRSPLDLALTWLKLNCFDHTEEFLLNHQEVTGDAACREKTWPSAVM